MKHEKNVTQCYWRYKSFYINHWFWKYHDWSHLLVFPILLQYLTLHYLKRWQKQNFLRLLILHTDHNIQLYSCCITAVRVQEVQTALTQKFKVYRNMWSTRSYLVLLCTGRQCLYLGPQLDKYVCDFPDPLMEISVLVVLSAEIFLILLPLLGVSNGAVFSVEIKDA